MNLVVDLLQGLTNPVVLFGHFTYALLIASMLMRKMVPLRILAVAAGLAKIVYRGVLIFDPVSVMWETVFVSVNIAQLIAIWYYTYHHRFREEHRHFAESMPPGIDKSAIKRLLDLAEARERAPGDVLTEEGRAVEELTYIADGIVKIEKAGQVVAICGPGDYIGELSFLTGNPASATATTVKPTKLVVFNQARLTAAIAADDRLRRTLEAALNRNLAGKLTRSSDPQPATA